MLLNFSHLFISYSSFSDSVLVIECILFKIMKRREFADHNERAKARQRKARREHCRAMRENVRLQRQMPPLPEVGVERVQLPEEIHRANESSQPLLEQPTQGLTGPICRSGIVRHEVDPNWPIGHRLFFQCRFQVRLVTLDSCFIHFFR